LVGSNALGPDVLAEATLASLRNARRLIYDAKLLLREGRYPTAHSLAVLALEEFGKHTMFAAAVARGHADPAYWRRLKRRLGDHSDKLRNALTLAGLTARTEKEIALLDDVAKAAEDQHFAKLRGLYVDVDPQEGVFDPDSKVSAEDSEWTVRIVEALLEIGALFEVDPSRLQAVVRDMAGEAVAKAQDAEAIANDPIRLVLAAELLRSAADDNRPK
jgi:AbiV family abortive infection protein